MRKQLYARISLVIAIVSAIGFLVAAARPVFDNAGLRRDFVPSERGLRGPYLNQEPLTLMGVVGAYFIEFATFDEPQEITALCRLRYYASPGGSQSALTIEEGDTFVLSGGRVCYGVNTCPTYRRGWRFVQPYAASLVEYNSYPKQEGLYVKLEDMLSFHEGILLDRYSGYAYTTDDLRRTVCDRTDDWLYEKGYCISPDKYEAVLTPLSITLLLVSLSGFGLFAVLSRKHTVKQ